MTEHPRFVAKIRREEHDVLHVEPDGEGLEVTIVREDEHAVVTMPREVAARLHAWLGEWLAEQEES